MSTEIRPPPPLYLDSGDGRKAPGGDGCQTGSRPGLRDHGPVRSRRRAGRRLCGDYRTLPGLQSRSAGRCHLPQWLARLGRNSRGDPPHSRARRPPHSRPPVAVSLLTGAARCRAAAAWFPALTTMAGLQANWDFLSDFQQRGTLALDALRAQAAQSPWGIASNGRILDEPRLRSMEEMYLPD